MICDGLIVGGCGIDGTIDVSAREDAGCMAYIVDGALDVGGSVGAENVRACDVLSGEEGVDVPNKLFRNKSVGEKTGRGDDVSEGGMESDSGGGEMGDVMSVL